jgi:cell division protein FtsZ
MPGAARLCYPARSREDISRAFSGASLIVLIAGLGGGTGSGATPVIAEIARGQNALVVAFVTLPFTFELRRRALQARDALAALNGEADFVVSLQNDALLDHVEPGTSMRGAFELFVTVFAAVYEALWAMRPGATAEDVRCSLLASTRLLPLPVALSGRHLD